MLHVLFRERGRARYGQRGGVVCALALALTLVSGVRGVGGEGGRSHGKKSISTYRWSGLSLRFYVCVTLVS